MIEIVEIMRHHALIYTSICCFHRLCLSITRSDIDQAEESQSEAQQGSLLLRHPCRKPQENTRQQKGDTFPLVLTITGTFLYYYKSTSCIKTTGSSKPAHRSSLLSASLSKPVSQSDAFLYFGGESKGTFLLYLHCIHI